MEIQRVTLSDQIYNNLKKNILDGTINFGEKLSNRELQKKYGVSSTPVRDAINRLYLDGLVDNYSNSGARVIDFDLNFTLNINEILSILCCASVELAAARADMKLIDAALSKNLRKQEAAIGSDTFYFYDDQFHKIFFDYCENPQCLKSYEQYHVLWEMLVRRFHYLQEEQRYSVEQHKAIYASFSHGRFHDAYDLMKKHFSRAEEIFKRHMS